MPTYTSGYSPAIPAWFRDTPARMTLVTTGPDNFYFTEAFPRVNVWLPPGAGTSFTVEAIYNPSQGITLDPQNNIGVRTSADPTGLTGLTYNQTIASPPSPPLNTRQQVTITLPAGTRFVELTGNGNITGLSAASYYVDPAPTVQRQAVVGGDSIACGNSASPVHLGMYQDAFRHGSRFDGVDIFAISGYLLFAYQGAETALAATWSARMVGTVENVLINEMGTNDFGRDFWNAADYQISLGRAYDAFHVTNPTTQIWHIQMGHRGTETAQPVHLSTLADFYTANVAVAATRPYVTLIPPLWSQAEIVANSSDGLHPNTALHAIAGARLVALFPAIPVVPPTPPAPRRITVQGRSVLAGGKLLRPIS